MDFINWLFHTDFGRGYLLGAVVQMIISVLLSAIRYYKDTNQTYQSNSTTISIKDSPTIKLPIGFRPAQITAKADTTLNKVSHL
jgi:hypothetical protein